ncbi:hypothetical protein NC653_038876 [Populus alba x Populus x berolinensis]|uniref:Uncharacterized protein n=1 Tax=Populus alba x Populus x berolinensis TaxID=444605 RepID=A0AAD6PRH1_9ROSI|nr:hypothetical protein NC653_038876 [Populus alba x Populus x berolinensis]
MGVGEGMGPNEATARALADSLYDENLGNAKGNVPHVVENGCGKFSKSPKEIAKDCCRMVWIQRQMKLKANVTKCTEAGQT